jgi:hypothetical protein
MMLRWRGVDEAFAEACSCSCVKIGVGQSPGSSSILRSRKSWTLSSPAVSIWVMAEKPSAAVEVAESKDRYEVRLRHEDGSARSSRRWEYNEADWLGALVRGCQSQ